MKKQILLPLIGTALAGVIVVSLMKERDNVKGTAFKDIQAVKSVSSPKASAEDASGRGKYFEDMLRDPYLDKIPDNIRRRELAFATEDDARYRSIRAARADRSIWKEVGPVDVGGRTRALGIDKRNSNIIIAGGVSGGLWRSTDKGANWTLVNNPDEYNGITALVQDPRSGHEDTWYYATGELVGNSARAAGWSSLYSGDGIYRSTDNGVTWSAVEGTTSALDTWNSMFDYISAVQINPVTGTVFFCANGYGIIRKPANSDDFELVLGAEKNSKWSDIAIDSEGKMIAYLSQAKEGYGSQTVSPGLYSSDNDGVTWTKMSISSNIYSSNTRALIRIAPSNKDIAYLYMVNGDDPFFYKIERISGTVTNRTTNCRFAFSGSSPYVSGKLGLQGDYNVTMEIHPTDENFIVVGSTSLFRSKDAFKTKPQSLYSWIGGYGTVSTATFKYPNHHPDCHISVFDPNDPDAMWSGHDGGLSYTPNIKQTVTSSTPLNWVDKNRGYNITQFYNVSISKDNKGERFVGGAQDNGSPYFTFDGTITSNSDDISSGDGSYCSIGSDYTYASSQYGRVIKYPNDFSSYAYCHPSGATNKDFIHPYILDPVDNNVMYFPESYKMWINSDLSAITSTNSSGTSVNWSKFNVASYGFKITALSASVTPANRLVVGAYRYGVSPKIFVIDNVKSPSRTVKELTIPNLPKSSYPHDIYINPANADEFIFVLSNYGVKGVYHTTDGGDNFTCIEGNLEGTADNPGPSIRSVAIIDGDPKIYYLGTSTGLYKTNTLDGNSTIWLKVKPNLIGSVVVNDLDVSTKAQKIVAGTHGRGMFVGQYNATEVDIDINKVDDIVLNINSGEVKSIDLNNVFVTAEDKVFSIENVSNTSVVNTLLQDNILKISGVQNMAGSSVVKVSCTAKGSKFNTSINVMVKYDLKSVYTKGDREIEIGESLTIPVTELFSYSVKPDFTVLSSNNDIVSIALESGNVVLTATDANIGTSDIRIKAKKFDREITVPFKAEVFYKLMVEKGTQLFNFNKGKSYSKTINLSDMFTYSQLPDCTVQNSNEQLVKASYSNGKVTITYNGENEGKADITVTVSKYGKSQNKTIKVNVDTNTAIGSITSNNIVIYPNPVTDIFTVNIPDADNIYTLRIYNQSGVVIYTDNNFKQEKTVDLSGKSAGVYYLELRKGNNIITKKIIKR
jgi:hypothetical protein